MMNDNARARQLMLDGLLYFLFLLHLQFKIAAIVRDDDL